MSSASGSKRKGGSSERESRERTKKGRRRGRREVRDSSEERKTPLVNRRKRRRSRELKYENESATMGQHNSDLALARRDPSRERRIGYQNPAFEDESTWETVSIDSIDIEL